MRCRKPVPTRNFERNAETSSSAPSCVYASIRHTAVDVRYGGSNRYGQYAGGTGADVQSIDTESIDLERYPGWVRGDAASQSHRTCAEAKLVPCRVRSHGGMRS
jgi:hypothetical protein